MQMTDLQMSRSLQNALSHERTPDLLRSSGSWPAEMQREWGTDMGKATARLARDASADQFRAVRHAIDEFHPDVVVLVAKDHFETVEPNEMFVPYWLSAFDQVTVKPYQPGNGLGESPDAEIVIPGARDFGLQLANGLREQGASPCVFNRPTSPVGLAHTFRSAFVHLDWDRRERIFPYPVLPIPFNDKGSRQRDVTGMEPLSSGQLLPSTMPEGFAFGRAIARVILAGDLRVALGVAAGWSHANDTAWHHSWLSPDIQADRQLFERWKAGELSCLAQLSQEELEDHGWWNLWGWAVLAGAMAQAGATIVYADLQTHWIFNSDWVTTVFEER